MNMYILPLYTFTQESPLKITKFIFFSDSEVPDEGEVCFYRTGKYLCQKMAKNLPRSSK